MSSNIEIEVKVLLTEEQYLTIINCLHLEQYHKIIQTNYYIDTQNHDIEQKGLSLRVREKNHELEFTLKTPLKDGVLEQNENIDYQTFSTLKETNICPNGEIKNSLNHLNIDINSLNVITSLTTERIEVELFDSHLDLDKSMYNGIIDYEIEIESTSISKAKELLENILNKCGIKNYSYNSISKKSRAFNSLKK